jgi:Fur family ferric uptake transcriptional regulator
MERNTRQRGAIRRAFQRADRPLSIAEVLEASRSEVASLGVATVYRNIKHLVEEGWLAVVQLPGAPDRYELEGQEHHHYFHCRSCDRVFRIAVCPPGLDQMLPPGFRHERHALTIRGLCRDCAEADSLR